MDIGFSQIITVIAVIFTIRALLAKFNSSSSHPSEPDPSHHPYTQAPQAPQAGGFEEIYNELRREILAKQRHLVVPPPTPPALPAAVLPATAKKARPVKAAKEPFVEMLSVAQQASLHRAETSNLSTWLPIAATSVEKAAGANKFFRDRAELRRALVMKEILDQPLAMRPRQESGRAS